MNIRELEKVSRSRRRATDSPALELADLPELVRNAVALSEDPACGGAGPMHADPNLSSRELRLREELISLLRVHGGNVRKVARAMSKGRNQIVRWMEKYQLDRHEFRNP